MVSDLESQSLSHGAHDQTYTVTIDDGHGGSAQQDITVTIQGHNSLPSGADHTVFMAEDVSTTFAVADFGFADLDGDHLAGIVIGTLPDPAAGLLLYANMAVAGGQFITAADIAAGMLTYAPADNVFGHAGDTGFTFQVRDDVPGASHLNTDPSPNTLTLTMLPTDFQDFSESAGDDTTTSVALAGANFSLSEHGGIGDLFQIETPAGTTFSDLEFLRSGDNLEVSWSANGGDRTATLLDQFLNVLQNRAFEEFALENGGAFDGFDLGTRHYAVASGLDGSGSDDIVVGGSASETLSGLDGNDLLYGNGGNDTLDGGTGNDLLFGGLGADIFKFAHTGASNVDTIVDYSGGNGDTLDLSDLLDADFHAGDSLADFVRLVNSGNGVVVQADVDGTAHNSTWADVAVLSNYHVPGNEVLIAFEHQVHQLTVAS